MPAIDLATLSPSDFADDELDLPYYLAHFHTVANAVRMSGPYRGFIDVPVWRPAHVNEPYNARIMENVLSLAFFYTTDRPWNPYYAHPAVRVRLEAALTYWVDMQQDDGRFTETGPERWTVSATGFATKFFGETLRLLTSGPSIDPVLLGRVRLAQRKAILAMLTQSELIELGQRFSNQYSNLWGGTLAYLDLFPDPDVRALFENTLQEIELQSSAGYFYEHNGPDWGYDLETHHSNHLMAWHYLRDSELGDLYADHVRLWYDWLVYNTAIDMNGAGFALNYSMTTRLYLPYYREGRETSYGDTCSPLAEVVKMARAFCESAEERSDRIRRERRTLEATWPAVAPLRTGEMAAYSPYAFLHRSHVEWHPTDEQKAEAIALLPYLANTRFTHQRTDDRTSLTTTFVRRPSYYATFTSGRQRTDQQRFGLGLVWTLRSGAVLQSQIRLDDAGWGTLASDGDEVYEVSLPAVRFSLDGEDVRILARPRDFPQGVVAISYALDSKGEKSIEFRKDGIAVDVLHLGSFTEQIPLLVRGDEEVEIFTRGATLGPLTLAFGGGNTAELPRRIGDPVRAKLLNTDRRVGSARVVVLQLQAEDSLHYDLRFAQ